MPKEGKTEKKRNLSQKLLEKALTKPLPSCIITLVQCESGGTGRRARLRGVWISPYGFKSRFSHQQRGDARVASPLCLCKHRDAEPSAKCRALRGMSPAPPRKQSRPCRRCRTCSTSVSRRSKSRYPKGCLLLFMQAPRRRTFREVQSTSRNESCTSEKANLTLPLVSMKPQGASC